MSVELSIGIGIISVMLVYLVLTYMFKTSIRWFFFLLIFLNMTILTRLIHQFAIDNTLSTGVIVAAFWSFWITLIVLFFMFFYVISLFWNAILKMIQRNKSQGYGDDLDKKV